MFNQTVIHDLIEKSEIKSLLEGLIYLSEFPISIQDIDKNLLLGQSVTTNSAKEYSITSNQQTIGLVKGDNLAQHIAQLLTYLANQEKLIFFDDLTQIPNRRYFNCYFQQEWERCQRENNPLSLLLCDLDNFKSFNDYYGHQNGDNCLKQVAQLLQKVLKRPGDKVFRYGGEEFAIILPNTAYEGGEIIARQLVQIVEQNQIPHHSSEINSFVSVSLGIAVMNSAEKISSQELFQIADIALYQAKNRGRNCYSLATIEDKLNQDKDMLNGNLACKFTRSITNYLKNDFLLL